MIFKKILTPTFIASLFVLNVFGKNNSKNQSPVTDEQKSWVSENKAIVIGLPAALLTGYILGLKINSNNDSSPEHKKALKNLKDLSDKVQQLETSVTNKEDIIKQLKLAGNDPLKIADLTQQLKNKEAEIARIQAKIQETNSELEKLKAQPNLGNGVKYALKEADRHLHEVEAGYENQIKAINEENKRQIQRYLEIIKKQSTDRKNSDLLYKELLKKHYSSEEEVEKAISLLKQTKPANQ